jgi:helicase
MKPQFHREIKYNPLQELTVKYLGNDCNLVVLAPTSSGKTFVAEQYLFTAIEQGHKAIYLSPLKSLTEEKKRAWSSHPYSMLIVTSDYGRPVSFQQELILMTTEALDSKTRGMKSWIRKVGALVVDEAHLLGSPGRGDALETGLMRFAEQNPQAKIILLSATIPNAKFFGEWLTRLNDKHTEVVESDWRPVQLYHNLVVSGDKEWNLNDKVVETVEEVERRFPGKQILVFVHSIGKGHTLSRALKCPFHYSKLAKNKKAGLEEAFETKKIYRMVSTSTLAWGRNLPADIVVIAGGERGPVEVWPIDVQQMAGRAGRFGYSTEGHVFYVFKRHHAKRYYEEVTHIPPVESVLDQRLHFHIVSFIYREKMQYEDIISFLKKSFYGELDIAKHLDKLVEYDIVRNLNGVLSVSNIGKASALMYIDPYDLYALVANLCDYPKDPTELAKAFANIPSYAYPCFIPEDIEKTAVQMPHAHQTIIATCLRQWLRGEELSVSANVVIPPIVADLERWLSGLVIAGVNDVYVESIRHMLLNGVSEDLTELVSIPGVGRKRAVRLYESGIRSQSDIPKNPTVAKNIMTGPVYDRFMDAINSPGKIILRF